MAGTGYYATLNLKKINSLTKTFGNSSLANAQSAFSASPIHSGEINSQERLEIFQAIVLDGDVNTADYKNQGLNGPGHGFDEFNRDYVDTPDVAGIDITNDAVLGEKLPSPYMPNPSSPGPGIVDPQQKPDFEGNVPDPANRNNHGVGFKSTYNPKNFTDIIKNSGPINQYDKKGNSTPLGS